MVIALSVQSTLNALLYNPPVMRQLSNHNASCEQASNAITNDGWPLRGLNYTPGGNQRENERTKRENWRNCPDLLDAPITIICSDCSDSSDCSDCSDCSDWSDCSDCEICLT